VAGSSLPIRCAEGPGIRRGPPAGPLTEEVVVNQSSTVATWNTGLSAAPHRVACSSPGHREGFDPGDTGAAGNGDRDRADALRWQGLS
jgi:hypothetical protein